MVKVLDPEGIIIGVYEIAKDVPAKLPNRWCTYWYPKSHLEIVEVTDPKDQQRLQKTLERFMNELRRDE